MKLSRSAAATDSAPSVMTAPREDPGPGATRSPWLEAAALLLAPVAVFFGLHVMRMARATMIDPYFYTAYAQNGRDLITRYGDDIYFWVRLGFILPARAFYLAFGAVPGFYAFRYVLALVAVAPTYLLVRRLRGRAAGALAVAVVLSCPVLLYAWGTDYPDSSATSYLAAGTTCLVMPTTSRRRRLVWVTLAGIALALAVHSQAVAAPLAAAVVLAYAVVYLRQKRGDVVAHLLLLALCALVVTGGLAMLAQWVFGSHDIITPTVEIARRVHGSRLIANYHTPVSGWLPYFPYLAVPLVALVGWGIARLGARDSPSAAEITVVGAAGLQGLAYVWLQFPGKNWTLEYHLYSSMLWPGVCLVTGFLFVAVCAPLLKRQATAMLPVALVLLLPLVATRFRPWMRFGMVPVGVVVVVGVLSAVLAARLVPRAAVAAVAVGLVVVGCFALTIDAPPGKRNGYPPRPGYASVIGGEGRVLVDRYRVASMLHLVVPPARFPGDDLLLWYPPHPRGLVNQASAQYRWKQNALWATLPDLSPKTARKLYRRSPQLLVLLSVTGQEFPAAVRALARAGLAPSVVRREVLTAGTERLCVWVVQLGRFAAP